MNHVWAYDFVFETCADGRSLKWIVGTIQSVQTGGASYANPSSRK